MREPAVGEILAGKYEVRGVLGRGGMGLVVSAWHKELGQKVAIKYLLPEALLSSEMVERFAREARAAAKIRGEHVVRILDVGKLEDGRPFMVMEHLEGTDLAVELERQGRLSVTDAVRCVLEACEALAQAHAARIVHRDLKPSNLFLAARPGRRPTIKVLDFGISKFKDPESDAITKTAAVIGTAHYMSPEQLLSAKSVDERSDLWSLGIILYQLTVGDPPFTGDSAPEIIAKIIQNAPRPPRELRPDLPAGLEAVILRCLRTAPGERFADVGELASALLPYAAPEDAECVTAIARVVGESSRPVEPGSSAAERSEPPRRSSLAATPLEIASTITELPAVAKSGVARTRRVGLLTVAALAVTGALLAWASRRPPPIVAAAPSSEATSSAPAASPLPAASLPLPSTSVAEAVASLQPPTAPPAAAPLAPPSRLAAPPPRPRPLASAARPTPSATPSAAPSSRPAGADPLDIPLR